jgi:two-component system OmpR family sensor kinase
VSGRAERQAERAQRRQRMLAKRLEHIEYWETFRRFRMERDKTHAQYGHRKRLRHQLFLSFGLSIMMTMMSAGFVSMVMWRTHAPTPIWRLLTLAAAGCVLWIVSGALAHRLAWPLWELSRAVKDFGAGKLDRRAQLPQRSPLEVAELAGSFNDMAGRIQALVNGQRELMGAVSHELRTPLARLRVLVALLQERAGDPALVAKFEREILEMDALVGELLAEARITAGALTLRPLDLADVIHECAERLGIALAHVEVAAQATGDPTLISRAITIVLDNAVKHGGRSVRCYVNQRANAVRISVEDDGPGFDPADLPKLFAAFARGRGAEADENRGVGLGLYLVRRIAEAHGGSVFAENVQGGGARVGFELPTP